MRGLLILAMLLPMPVMACEAPTMAQFKSIKLHMSVEEVQKIMGCEGDSISETVVGDENIKMLTFRGAGGIPMIAGTFLNDKLNSKSQYGVK